MKKNDNFGPMYSNGQNEAGTIKIAAYFLAIITAFLVIAKLGGWLHFHWALVLAPLYLPVVILAACTLLAILMSLISDDQMVDVEKEMEDLERNPNDDEEEEQP